MMARERRFGMTRRTNLKVGAAVLAASGAIAAGAVVATSGGHAAPTTVQAAGYSNQYYSNMGNVLSSALGSWGSSRQSSYNMLSGLTSARTFGQSMHHGRMLAIQRGIVVLATKNFVILQSANGSLHLWLLSGGTQFQNVSTSTSGTSALTASSWATQAAMQSNNMIPAATTMAGSPTTAAALLTPAAAPQTVTVQVANTNLTVTVTVTKRSAMVNQTATTPWNGMPSWWQNTFTQNAWMPVRTLARGDLATIVGFRSHWLLHAQLILFTPLSTTDVGGRTGIAPAATTNNGTVVNQGTTSVQHW